MLQCVERRAELELRAAVRGDQPAVGAEGDAGEQRIDAFLVRMKAQPQRFRALVREQVVLDQLRGHPHERERMRLEPRGSPLTSSVPSVRPNGSKIGAHEQVRM